MDRRMQIQLFLRGAISRPCMQPLWRVLLKLSHAGMNTGGGQSVCDSGEDFALHRVMKLVRRNERMVIFDVGAHNGEYALMVSQVLSKGDYLYCFEPQPDIYLGLSQRFCENRQVICENIALGKENGIVKLFFTRPGDTIASLKKNELIKSFTAMEQSVELMTLDKFCNLRGIATVDFLKIDVEGSEMDVLQGAQEMLSYKRIKAIQFEFGETYVGSGIYFKSFWNILSNEYRIFRVLRRGLFEIKEYSWDHEIFKIANYIAILR
jgi:FkbM family methyltransferase